MLQNTRVTAFTVFESFFDALDVKRKEPEQKEESSPHCIEKNMYIHFL